MSRWDCLFPPKVDGSGEIHVCGYGYKDSSPEPSTFDPRGPVISVLASEEPWWVGALSPFTLTTRVLGI